MSERVSECSHEMLPDLAEQTVESLLAVVVLGVHPNDPDDAQESWEECLDGPGAPTPQLLA